LKKKWKVILPVLLAAGVAIGLFAKQEIAKRNLVTVQTARSVRQDLTALVTASGEIKPRNYINIGTNASVPSRITEILVVEGQRVRKGQLLARLESVQPEAEVAAQRANLAAAEAESAAAESGVRAADENLRTAEAGLQRAKADLDRARIFFERAEKLWKEQLIARQEFDQRQAEYQAQEAVVREAEARVAQFRAQRSQIQANLMSAQRRVAVAQANLQRATDVLQRTQSVAPIDGVVTNLPVRVGETVVPGIQNSAASLIMTIADMSLITAEVKVDETDIVNVTLDQVADVTIDAIPGKTFKGRVIEIGNTAILRSTGLAASQSAISSQEAKDFKVVVALDNPPEEIRPGLSATARIITATRKNVVTIPIQALTVRQKGDLEAQPDDDKKKANEAIDPIAEKEKKQELQGVFVVENGKAIFKTLETGITGATDIEVVKGLEEGAEVVTGSYKVIRTIKNEAKVKVDNKAPKKADA
jgi:HlyD family secretion protein